MESVGGNHSSLSLFFSLHLAHFLTILYLLTQLFLSKCSLLVLDRFFLVDTSFTVRFDKNSVLIYNRLLYLSK